MKQGIIYLTVGLCIGMLIMTNQVCKQKDSMIRYLMKANNGGSNTELANIPKGLPIVNI